jgi:heme-degrading monooxygenase HmoA
MPVTLINVFSVPKGKEDEFVKWWQDVKAKITTQRRKRGHSVLACRISPNRRFSPAAQPTVA